MGLQGQTGAQAATSGNTQGVSLRIGIGASSASSKATTYDESAYGSQISSAGNVTVAATHGDLHVIGSQINGNNVALSATNNISLLSQAEQHTDTSSSHNGSGEIGYSMGAQTGFYVTASAGQGQGHGNGTTYANSAVTATNTLSLISGNDTTIEGAQAKGNTVLAAIGGNLDITSQQTTNAYNSSNWQAGGTFVYGSGGSVNISAGNTKSNYASVAQVSGIGAGSGGYAIDVNGNTNLTGGVIASTAAPDLNLLSTGTLTTSDLKNQANYSAAQGGISAGYSSGGGFGASPSLAIPQGGNASSVTQAGIAQGTIDVRDNPTQDLSGINRAPDLNATGLNPIFNAQTVANNQLAGQLAGQVGMTAAGDIGQHMQQQAVASGNAAQAQAWSAGGADEVALHTLVGAATATLGGGNALQGALGAGTSEAADKLQLTTNPTEQNLLSAGIGALVGGGAGVSTALTGTIYNDQHHYADYQNKLQACQQSPSASGCSTILAMQGTHSELLTQPDAANPTGVIVNLDASGQPVSYTLTNATGQPTLIMQPSDYQNYLATIDSYGGSIYQFIGNNSPEYSLQLNNAVNDLANGQGAQAAGNLAGMFSNGSYWRDMGIGMTAAAGAVLSSNVGTAAASTDTAASGVATSSSPAVEATDAAQPSQAANAGVAASQLPQSTQSVESLLGQTISAPEVSHTAGLQNGVLGEDVALRTLNQETGLTFEPLQNNSNNGADGVTIDSSTGTIWVAEVKSSQNGASSAASATGNPTAQLTTWVDESLNPSKGSAWQSQPASNQVLAQQIQDAIDAGYQVKGVQVQVGVPAPGSTGVPQVRITPWASN